MTSELTNSRKRCLDVPLVLSCAVLLAILLSGCSIHHHHYREGEAPAEPNRRANEARAGLNVKRVGVHALAHSTRRSTPKHELQPQTATLGEPRPPATGEIAPKPAAITLAQYQSDEEPADKTDRPAELPAPQELTPTGLTLDQAIGVTLMADPRLRAGFEAINQAGADAITAALLPNPELEVLQSLLPLTRPFTPEREGGPPQFDVLLKYPIDWFLFGKRTAAMASAAMGVRVSESEYADLVRQRVMETAVAFFGLLEAKALADLAQQNLANFERLEAITRKAVEAGGLPKVELSRVRLDQLTARQELREAQAELVKARAELRSLLGRADPDPIFDIAGTLDMPLIVEPLPVEEALNMALTNRPDLAALSLQIAQAQADVEVERRNAYPEVAPMVGYSRQFQRRVLEMPDANSWAIGVEMTLPIFNRNQGERARAASLLAQASFEYQTALVELRAEMESIVQELRLARANAESVAEEQLKLAEQILDSITKSYAVGARPLIDVLDAQRLYNETYTLFITSRADYWRNVYRFSAAIGKQAVPHHVPGP